MGLRPLGLRRGPSLSGWFPGFLPRLLRPAGRPSTRVAWFWQRDGELECAALVSAYCTWGRGNLVAPVSWKRSRRSIPAWTGEPAWKSAVYPRVGGGTWGLSPRNRHHPVPGLSPRGRGNLIPVYPRVGGGTASGPQAAGLSPRGRGNLRLTQVLPVYPRVGGGTQ